MFGVTVTIPFEAAHRIVGHQGKCRHLHGHSYRADIHLRCDTLNQLGMVVDFGEVKKVVKQWIDSNWDHNIILSEGDPLSKLGRLMHQQGIWSSQFAWNDGKGPYIMAEYRQPTAELMAQELYEVIHKLFVGVEMTIVIHEGFPGGQALYSPLPMKET